MRMFTTKRKKEVASVYLNYYEEWVNISETASSKEQEYIALINGDRCLDIVLKSLNCKSVEEAKYILDNE